MQSVSFTFAVCRWTLPLSVCGALHCGGAHQEPAVRSISSFETDAGFVGSAPSDSGGVGANGPDPCVGAGTCPLGTWIDVTPTNANLTDSLQCGNYGVQSVGVDPESPSSVYAEFNCQGIWKSTDYGTTWTGPINTGSNGATAGNCAGGFAIADGGPGKPPILYEACIRGATGFWVSTDGGVSWTPHNISPLAINRQDVYPPAVDPNNPKHLLMTGHEQNAIVESTDGGQTWKNVPMASGMLENGGTGFAFFVNTGTPATTSQTWLWIAQQSGGIYGTWRTENSGASWTRVSNNEHPHGASQVYSQPNGTVYMAGAYAAEGWGVLVSSDFGKTWAHVGATAPETAVWASASGASSQNVYAGYGWADGLTAKDAPNLETAPNVPAASWSNEAAPARLVEGPAGVVTTFDGTHSIFIGGMWQSGIWKYVEP